jgi:hypothetical protein
VRLLTLAALFAVLAICVVGYAPANDEKQTRVQGRTVFQWHRVAVHRRVERDEARTKAGKAVRLSRHLMRVNRRLAGRDSVLTHPLEKGLLCIHGYEGAWTDPASPYYGGLQMDRDFQEAYGSEFLAYFGTANRWPVSVQIAVAIKAYISGRGYGPWPTRRYCGL